ncbi:hypothetical protein NC653_039057 [Populus alba x Populus x berolinensis]|uniref:Uncharacterized protein n=1 Tax=Populus alba x Populus x berolinensis TaxID=444605 RepID=A0AAD6LAA9_9ROSI|nr:hypothetical protein NC653_039057 [Populus alba x Populus x berolinensis]
MKLEFTLSKRWSVSFVLKKNQRTLCHQVPLKLGSCELPEVSELLFSTCPLPTTHNLSKILLDRDGSSCTPLLVLLLFFFSSFPFFPEVFVFYLHSTHLFLEGFVIVGCCLLPLFICVCCGI